MLKGRQFDQSVILLCVRWYLAYSLSLRDLEEMMAERGIARRPHEYSPLDGPLCPATAGAFQPTQAERYRQMAYRRDVHQGPRPVDVPLPRAPSTVSASSVTCCRPSGSSERCRPDRVVIDGSQTNLEAIVSCDTTNRLQDRPRRRLKLIEIRKSKYLSNRIEQDHRRIKRRVGPMLGFKSQATAAIILSCIEMVHMMRKRQARFACNPNPSRAEQFEILAT
ncbi:hypothetical protein FHW16_004626 [Phyllobacterium myrsinacearum]|uniref:DDE domain-containing protein n=1 Tax=Phyllobacterium myrsinacearum TaxID=28101 RepID=A0A839ELG2_9HYPH|nr:transposase [Phyllobacterium myrsinacearum]MBA8880891.1 hypothetical protein [Phyllobacterium myrsinacearum]